MHTVELSAGTIEYDAYGPAEGRSVLRARLRDGRIAVAPAGPAAGRTQPALLRAHLARRPPPGDAAGGGGDHARVAAMVDEFLTALDLDDVVLVGNDTGGAIAQIVAGEFGDRVGALVLTSCDAFEHFRRRSWPR